MKGSSKIHYHGRDYGSFKELPPEAQAAYHKAAGSGIVALNHLLDNILVSRRPRGAGRREGRWLYEDVMSVVETNGQVTLPGNDERFLTRRQLKVAAAVAGALALVGLAVVLR